MIAAATDVKILVATKPVDFRKSADGLAALVREQLRHDPFAGTIFIFRAKRADRLKILAWDGSGLVIISKLRYCRQSPPFLPRGASFVALRVQVPAWFHALVEHPYDLHEARPNDTVE